MGTWAFAELPDDAARRDPNEAELFKTEEAGDDEYAGTDALVREVLQNALDAAAPGEIVHVRFAVREASDVPPPDRLAHYFTRLREPLRARGVEYSDDGIPTLPCRFLVCEDFGTCGLEGDVKLARDPPLSSRDRHDFYWFWRNIGRSSKTGDDLGRWGLGKTVYRAASRVAAMLAMTVRRSDRRRLVIGQAVQQIHVLGDKLYMPEGFWCRENTRSSLPEPIEDVAEVERFRAEWHLTRSTEPGLSVVAPFLHEGVRAQRIVQAVAVHFFTRILRGGLSVEVVGAGSDRVSLDTSTLADVCAAIPWGGHKREKRHAAPPIGFVRACLQRGPPPCTTDILGRTHVPHLSDADFPEPTLRGLRQRFIACETVGVRVRMWLPQLQGDGVEGHCDVWLQRHPDGERCDAYFVREGMTITKINAQAALRGVSSLVLVDKGPLATLLGDCETPAHEDWLKSAERPDRLWKGWKGRVAFVKRIVDTLVDVLKPAAAEPDFDLLSDFFSIDRRPATQRRRAAGDERDGNGAEFEPPEAAKPKWFHITEIKGGFTVSRVAAVSLPSRPSLRVAMGYDLSRGDPIRCWTPLDFRIGIEPGCLKPTGRGVAAKRVEGNIVQLAVNSEKFQFSVRGFDPHRDLLVRVDDMSGNGEADE